MRKKLIRAYGIVWLRLQMADLKEAMLLIGQSREGGCSTAQLPKGKKNICSSLHLSGFK